MPNDLVKRYEPTDRERKMAALAHASVLFSFGLAAPIIWLLFRGNSPFIARHAGRASLTQIVGGVAINLIGGVTCGIGYLLAVPWLGFNLWEARNAWKGKWDAFERKQLK